MTMGRSGNGLLTAKVGSLDDVNSLTETLKGVDAVVSAAGSRRGGSEVCNDCSIDCAERESALVLAEETLQVLLDDLPHLERNKQQDKVFD